jgi:hypothetical protein
MELHALAETVTLIRDGGSMVLLVLAIVGGFRGWYVWRWQYDEKIASCQEELDEARAQRDEWKKMALRGIEFAERVTG